jgi:hypothetical protein
MSPLGYYKYIQNRKTCCTCGIMGKMDASHIKAVGTGRNRKKELLCHYSIVPQCRMCHQELHRLGLKRFEQTFDLNLYEVNQNYLVSYIYDCTNIGEIATERKIKEIVFDV